MIKKIKEWDWDIIKLVLATAGASILVAWVFTAMLWLAMSPIILIEYLLK